ncbi:FGGY-family carbohydrate kinase [Metasolibacillus sp. FSL H7-0170]|uniref:xylulokinase n=1 Tax=Metasolibacillus sp. FSL H7-0170 TaxID=2921431 RepID=UPI00315958C2
MKKYLLGIDIGTSSCKVTLFHLNGRVVAQESEIYALHYPNDGWVEQDPDEWWEKVTLCIKKILSIGTFQADEIAGIGIAGQGWAAIPVDKEGNCLRKTPIWLDTRARNVWQDIEEEVEKEEIFHISKNAWSPSYTTPKLMWFKKHEPEIFENTYQFLQSNSYIALKLTGVFSSDRCQNYGLHIYDPIKYEYNPKLAMKLGIPLDKLPPIYASHEIIGYVHEKAYEQTGLTIGTPVVAGGLDAACGTLGAGVLQPYETQLQGGQAGGISICLDEVKAHPDLIFSPHVVPNRWLLQGGTVGGGGALRWFKQEFGAQQSFQDFTMNVDTIPPGSEGVLFLPYLSGERSPLWNPHAKGVFYGLGFDKTKDHMIRAVLEGVALSVKHNLLVAKDAGVDLDKLSLYAMGGAANSELWIQIYSDVTNCKIYVPSSDTATTLGAALLAGVGVGVYSSFEEAVEKTVQLQREHTPNSENIGIYGQSMDKYLQLSKLLTDGMYNEQGTI